MEASSGRNENHQNDDDNDNNNNNERQPEMKGLGPNTTRIARKGKQSAERRRHRPLKYL